MVMNDIKEADLPPVRVNWAATDILKALDGDKALAEKLQSDLGVDLQGRPLPRLKTSSLANGIVVQIPVEVTVPIAGAPRKMTAHIEQPFQSRFSMEVDKLLQELNLRGASDEAAYKAAILQRASELPAEGNYQDVAASLRTVADIQNAKRYVPAVDRVLTNAFVILNDSFIEDADYTEETDEENQAYYSLHLTLNEEGRRRLWQYSLRNRGHQLLVIVDGIAVAAPLIRNDLRDSTVDVTRLQELSLVEDTIKLVKELREERKQK
jgi:hypothetical protein